MSAMTTKVKAGKVCGVVGLGDIKKTKEAVELITKVSAESKRFLLVISEKNYDVKKFFVNIANMKIVRGENLNAYDVYFGGKIILDEELFKPKNERNSRKKFPRSERISIARHCRGLPKWLQEYELAFFSRSVD